MYCFFKLSVFFLFGLLFVLPLEAFAQQRTVNGSLVTTPYREQGMMVSVLANFELSWDESHGLLGSRNYKLMLTTLTGTPDYGKGFEHRGKIYHINDFDGRLESFFQMVRITGITYRVHIDDLKESYCRLYYSENAFQGSYQTKFCEPTGSAVAIRNIEISRIHLSGIHDLRRRIDQMESELADRIARERADSSASATRPPLNNNTVVTTPDQLALQRMRASAQALEAEGDRLNAMGSAFAMQALQKYQEAQSVFYTDRVQAKINRINGEIQLAQGLIELGGAVTRELDEITDLLDPQGKTSWSGLSFVYVGELGSFGDADAIMPNATFISMGMNFLAISFDARVGYYTLPVREYSIYRQGWNRTIPQTAELSVNAWGPGFSAGFNLPAKHFMIYGLYGVDFLFETKYRVRANDFVYDNDLYPGPSSERLNRLSTGVNFQIPGIKMVMGVSYNIYTLPGKDPSHLGRLEYVGNDSSYRISSQNRFNNYYRLHKDLSDKYQFRNFGFHLMYRFNTP